jgi:glyoxylase-like metal-dependent hydrolase (beta-lactamase superfamily II)
MKPDVQALYDVTTGTVSYVVADPGTSFAAVIDPVLDFEPKAARLSTASADNLLAVIDERGLKLAYVLETHVHADHLSAADYLRRRTGAKVAIGAQTVGIQAQFAEQFAADDLSADGAAFDHLLQEGDTLALGDLTIGVLDTPGHTPADVTYLIGDAAFVGDTLMMPDYGTARADFPGGDAATLFRSIHRILSLPPETRIFVCHDYPPPGRAEVRWETTVGAQVSQNIHVGQGAGEAAFVAMREARDATLATPTLMLAALQVNIRGGGLPPAAACGRVFLKLPVTLA